MKAQKLIHQLCEFWLPPPDLTVSQWADRYRYLSVESSSEPGKWTTLPFQRGPLDAVSDPTVRRVVIRAATQMLKTVAIENGIGYFAHLDPGPILVLQPRDSDAKAFSKERIAPMIRDTPALHEIFAKSKSRSSSNTIEQKLFVGGMLALSSAGAAGNLRRRAIRFLFCDEVDIYPPTVGGQGNVISQARKRLTTFRHRAKEILTCSPTVAGSEIDRAYESSDRREYYVPCHACGHMQSMMLRFRMQVRWNETLPSREEQAASARYHCEECDAPWDDAERWKAVERGEWRGHAPFRGIAGFWISELYSPWKQLSEIVFDFLSKQGNVEDLKTFVQTSLAENWLEKGEAPEWENLLDRRESYQPGTVPRGGLFLTAGVDVQRDRLEVEVVAWGRQRESWSVDYQIFEGKTSELEVWKKLEEFRGNTYPTAKGIELPISRMFVDSGDGTTTNDVYSWVRTQPAGQVVAIKGTDRGILPVGQPSHVEITIAGKKIKRGLKIRMVNVSFFKAELYADLKKRPPTEEERAQGWSYPPGYCHFPQGGNYGDEHFKQLCAEQLMTHMNRRTKRTKTEWHQIRPRNESLDCFDAMTEVLTHAGWKRFADLSASDPLATVNLDTDAIEYQKPAALIVREHFGEMLQIVGRRIDILVTPNHRMVTYKKVFDRKLMKWNFDVPAQITTAKDLTIHHQLKMTGTWVGNGCSTIEIPASTKDSDGSQIQPKGIVSAHDMAEFFGWYVADGGCFTGVSRTQGNRRYRVEISQNPGPKADKIEKLLKKLPWKWNRIKGAGRGLKFVCTSKQLFQFLGEAQGKQDVRRAPQWIKDSDPSVISRFLEAAILGDGWSQQDDHSRPFRTIATICRELAGDYQELFIKTGCASNIKRHEAGPYTIQGRTGTNTRPQYHVSECTRKKVSLDGGGNGKREFLGKMIPYEGMVYCATVPNGTLICRRNGRSFLAGNCRVYSRAAAWDLGMDRMQEKHWRSLEEQLRDAPVKVEAKPQETREAAAMRRSGPPPNWRESSWLGDRGRGWLSR